MLRATRSKTPFRTQENNSTFSKSRGKDRKKLCKLSHLHSQADKAKHQLPDLDLEHPGRLDQHQLPLHGGDSEESDDNADDSGETTGGFGIMDFFRMIGDYKIDPRLGYGDSTTDQLNAVHTCVLLVTIGALIQAKYLLETPVNCFCPAHFTKSQEDYADSVSAYDDFFLSNTMGHFIENSQV